MKARMPETTAGLEKPDSFWGRTKIDSTCEFNAYTAIFVQTIVYCTESAHLAPQNLQQLYAFHYNTTNISINPKTPPTIHRY